MGERGSSAHRICTGCVALLALILSCAPAATAAASRTIRYRALRVSVPQTWPVRPTGGQACVRLDRRAIYIGRQGAGAACPAHATGATRAVHIHPLTRSLLQSMSFERRPTLEAGIRAWRSSH